MSRFLFFGLSLLVVAGCQPPASRVAESSDDIIGELRVGTPTQHGKLTIFPVISGTAETDDRFITLDEGLKSGLIEISELGGNAEPFAGFSDSDLLDGDPSIPPREATQRESIASIAMGAEVNRLSVINRSAKPLFLMSGEVLIGGKQDRTIGTEVVIAPSKQPTPINAYCVEHGRWQGRGVDGLALLARNNNASGASALALSGRYGVRADSAVRANPTRTPPLIITEALSGHDPRSRVDSNVASSRPIARPFGCGLDDNRSGIIDEGQVVEGSPQRPGAVDLDSVDSRDIVATLANKADSGKFVASGGAVNRSIRFRVVGARSQNEVWDAVAKTNIASGNDVFQATGALTGNYFAPAVVEKLDPFVAALDKPIASNERVVGVIVAVDDKIVTMDVFESTPLFLKMWPKLLRSYALDAVVAEADKEAVAKRSQAPSEADAHRFLADALTAKASPPESKDGLVLTRREGTHCISYSSVEAQIEDNQRSPDDGTPKTALDVVQSRDVGVHTSAFGR